MKTGMGLGLLASVLIASPLWAQFGAPAAPAPPGLPGAPAAPAAPAGPPNLFSMLLPSAEQCAKFKECIHNSPLGDMLKSMAQPVALATGGLIGGKCGVPTAEDLAKLAATKDPAGAEGAAAAIQKSEAEAKARRAAVRYLGTVDCNYWPEAKGALIAALRGDPNECVRYEAALALGRGCCCNNETIEALKESVNAKKTAFPAENSDRVRAAAGEALARCAAEFTEAVEEQKKKVERGEGALGAAMPRHVPPHGLGLMGILTGASANSPRPVMSVQANPMPQGPIEQTTATDTATVQPTMVQPTMVQQPARRGIRQIFTVGYSNYKAQVSGSSQPASNVAAPVVAAPTRGWVILDEENMPPAAPRPK